jgi:hypothetical protein
MAERLRSKGKSSSSSTEKYVDVQEIRDGVVVLKSGALRSIILVSSVNFDLKSTDEQDAIVYQYQNFLNSLDFPIQILVSSRKFNINPYLDMIAEKEKVQENELLRLQMAEYRDFIRNLTQITNIMSKFFYIVVPFSPLEDQTSGFLSKLTSIFNPQRSILLEREKFETYKNQLLQRTDHVIAGLSGTGARGVTLKTEDVIELLYNSYNPSLFTNTIVSDLENIEIKNVH